MREHAVFDCANATFSILLTDFSTSRVGIEKQIIM
jgi:hypothetical protein